MKKLGTHARANNLAERINRRLEQGLITKEVALSLITKVVYTLTNLTTSYEKEVYFRTIDDTLSEAWQNWLKRDSVEIVKREVL